MSNYIDYDNAVELFTEVGNKRKGSESMQESLLKSTVGWTGKNLLKNTATSKTVDGLTFTVNSDGSVTVNGTCELQSGTYGNYIIISRVDDSFYLPDGKYILNGCPSGGASNRYMLRMQCTRDSSLYSFGDDIGNGFEFTPLSTDRLQVIIRYYGGVTFDNLTFYPMLRDASITDDTYEPYHESVEEVVEQIYADNGVLGAKNLLLNTSSSGTYNGITFTKNSDGSVTVNGTATDLAWRSIGSLKLPVGKYILNGCPSGGDTGPATYCIALWNTDGGTAGSIINVRDAGEGVIVDITRELTYLVSVGIANGQTVNNLTFYPMLRLASDPDDTYVSYAMTNRELTETVNNISPSLISTSMPSYVANSLPIRKKNITDDFYNGTLREEIAAGNFANVRPGDYIIGQSSGSTYYVACLDYRLGKGDQTNNTNYPAYGTHHLGLMLFKHNGATRLWAGYGNQDKSWRVSANEKGRCPWNAAADVDPTDSEAIGTNNTNITRQYNGANVSGYMGSFIRERIDAIILTEDFIADFGSANVLKYRETNGNTVATDKPSGGQGNWNGCTSGWSWYDRFLDLPSEIELYGSRVFSSAYDTGCQCEQLPLFRNAAIHDFFPRTDIWTKAVASSSSAACRGGSGRASSTIASDALWACPLGCVK